MNCSFVSVVFALVVGAALQAHGLPAGPAAPQSGPDLSGRWNRDDSRSGDGAGWGPRVEITQSGVNVTVQPTPGTPSRFRLDGKETAEAIDVDGCRVTARITRAVTTPDRVTITTWIADKPACIHGEDEDDPLVARPGAVDAEKVFGRRRLESITAIYRDGDRLTVETTRSSGGGAPATTTTTYRK
jgi:hypothetical protein